MLAAIRRPLLLTSPRLRPAPLRPAPLLARPATTIEPPKWTIAELRATAAASYIPEIIALIVDKEAEIAALRAKTARLLLQRRRHKVMFNRRAECKQVCKKPVRAAAASPKPSVGQLEYEEAMAMYRK